MISPAYRLDWYTHLTTHSGAPAASTHYKEDFSLGQVAWGDYASPTYKAHTGYWAGIPYSFGLRLPLIIR